MNLKSLFTRNIGWKLLSLLAAIGVWANVASEPEVTSIVSVPVEYRNFPTGLEISSDIVETVDVEAHGPPRLLRDLDTRLAAVIDLAPVHAPGVRTFTMNDSILHMPADVTLIRTIPAQLRFRFEARETRLVPVQISFSGLLPPGEEIASYEVDPPQLEIAGPESRVLAVRTLQADPFDVTGLTSATTRTLSVYAGEPEVRILSTPQVTVKVQIQKSAGG